MTQSLPRSYQELRWGDDFDPTGAETASDLDSLEQDCLHVVAQAMGSNLDDPTRGVNAPGYLGGTSIKLAEMPGIIDAQLQDDPRIASSSSTLSLQSDGKYLIQSAIGVEGSVIEMNFLLGPNGLTLA
jgi:hypothetical protein